MLRGDKGMVMTRRIVAGALLVVGLLWAWGEVPRAEAEGYFPPWLLCSTTDVRSVTLATYRVPGTKRICIDDWYSQQGFAPAAETDAGLCDEYVADGRPAQRERVCTPLPIPLSPDEVWPDQLVCIVGRAYDGSSNRQGLGAIEVGWTPRQMMVSTGGSFV